MLKTNLQSPMVKIGLLASLFVFKAHADISDDYINKRVSEKIMAELERTPEPEKNKNIYMLPNWPFYGLFFEDKNLIQLSFNFEAASQAYSGKGHNENLSKLIFGEQTITIQDILLASKLVSGGFVTDTMMCATPGLTLTPYLGILATQPVIFDANVRQAFFAFDYARHFGKRDGAVGLHIPVTVRDQHLHLNNDITVANRQALSAASSLVGAGIPEFEAAGYNDLNDFVTAILAAKGIAFNKRDTRFGLGDITGYINFDIKTAYTDRFITGLSVLFPTAPRWDTRKLWDPGLGNGGFFEAAWFSDLLWEVNRWFNPYVNLKATYSFSSRVWRRVPEIDTFDGTTFNGVPIVALTDAKKFLVLGSSLAFIATEPFSLPDSTVRGFADQAIKVRIDRGPELFFRLGNTFDRVFSPKAFLDLYYDLHAKGKDYVHSINNFQTGILGHNSWSVSHTAGLNYSYQFDEHYRLRGGISYVFAGRNTPQTFGVDLALNAEF